jgi:meiotically up-regulated gene 157 (Mug157) protein
MRPSKQCRTFTSEAVENMINLTVAGIRDPDIARIFENTVASTLDTTIRYHNNSRTNPQSFVITGDINAEWLRDASFQLTPYYNLVANDSALATLIAGAVQTQAYFVNTSPYVRE